MAIAAEPTDAELEVAMQEAAKLDAEGKLPEVQLQEPPENLLRVVWRDKQGRRCATFIPIPEDVRDEFRAGLAAATPRFTAYTYGTSPEVEEFKGRLLSDEAILAGARKLDCAYERTDAALEWVATDVLQAAIRAAEEGE